MSENEMEYSGSIDKLRYISSENYYEGVIVRVTDGSVTIDLKGRLGQLMIPLRLLISNDPPVLGQEVGFLMTLPEVLDKELNRKYLDNIDREERKKAERNVDNKL